MEEHWTGSYFLTRPDPQFNWPKTPNPTKQKLHDPFRTNTRHNDTKHAPICKKCNKIFEQTNNLQYKHACIKAIKTNTSKMTKCFSSAHSSWHAKSSPSQRGSILHSTTTSLRPLLHSGAVRVVTPQFQYWAVVMDLELLVVVYVRSTAYMCSR